MSRAYKQELNKLLPSLNTLTKLPSDFLALLSEAFTKIGRAHV